MDFCLQKAGFLTERNKFPNVGKIFPVFLEKFFQGVQKKVKLQGKRGQVHKFYLKNRHR